MDEVSGGAEDAGRGASPCRCFGATLLFFPLQFGAQAFAVAEVWLNLKFIAAKGGDRATREIWPLSARVSKEIQAQIDRIEADNDEKNRISRCWQAKMTAD